MNFQIALSRFYKSNIYQQVFHHNPSYLRNIDHCAFRSLNQKQYDHIHQQCLNFNLIQQSDIYRFAEINVLSKWYKSQSSNKAGIPRVFLSLYQGEDLDRSKIYKYSDYLKYLETNHYVAWSLLFPYEINHIGYETDNIKDVYMDLKKSGFQLNNDIVVSDDRNLLQFSLKSQKVNYLFEEGYRPVYGSFIEFIERKNNREGFHTQNASKIFQSTKSS
jgi:hypothetical protein